MRPIVKKDGLDPGDTKNYRPVSNLTFLSKLIERMVYQQLTAYLEKQDLCQGHSQDSAEIIQPRLLFSRFSRIYWWLLTLEWSRFWDCWTCQQHSTLSIMIFWFAVSKHHSASWARLSPGFGPSWRNEHNRLSSMVIHHPRSQSPLAFHRDQSWDHCFFSFIRPISL